MKFNGYPTMEELVKLAKNPKNKSRQEDMKQFLERVDKIPQSKVVEGYDKLLVSNYMSDLTKMIRIY